MIADAISPEPVNMLRHLILLVMIFEHYIPNGRLGRFVDSFIYFEQLGSAHLIERFLPDGNVELVFTLKDEPQFIYDNQSLRKIQKCERAWASGVRTRPISIPSGDNSKMFVTIFRKGMAYPFFDVPMDELKDTVVDAEYVLGSEVLFVRERLAFAKTPLEKFRIVEEFLLSRLDTNAADSDFLHYGVSRIVSDPTGLCLSKLTNEIGYSRRHFISRFKTGVGLSPKRYMRVLRFQKAVKEIETQAIDWAGIALECGYYDQSHFINDFRSFSGFTPAEYLNRKNGNVNYVPVA